jgi:hypothetical protein
MTALRSLLSCFLLLCAALLYGASSAGAAERLMIAESKANEYVVIDYFSVTGNRSISRQYFIRGGDTKLLTAHRNIVEWRNRAPHVVNKFLLGDLTLTADDVLGLDALLVFYAARIPGSCDTQDTIQVEFYRDGRSIGQFTYQDDTCFLAAKDSAETRARTRSKISDALMDVLVTFRQVDERIRAANP